MELRVRRPGRVLLALLTATLALGPASPAVARTTPGALPLGADRLLVVVSEPGSGVGSGALRAAGAELLRSLPDLDAQVVRADGPGARARLEARAGVRYVEPLVTRTALSDAVTAERAELALDEARAAFPEADGRGTVVAVLDTGVDAANPDLTGRLSDGGDFTGGERRPGGLVDDNGHGTGVAAILAAADDGQGLLGAAPATTVRSYRVLDAQGAGGSLGLALAVRQVADDAAAGLPIVAANMSLGGPFRSRIEAEALAYAAQVAPQVLFVAAAGNDGGTRPSFPAAFAGVLSVGASERGGDGLYRRAGFSTTGDVDLLAPGVDVLTYDYLPGATPPTLGRVSGTSEAAPAVAGLVAGLASGRGVGGQQAAAVLKAAAQVAHGSGGRLAPGPGQAGFGDPGDGSGRVDAVRAIRLADGATPYATVFADLGSRVSPEQARRLVVESFTPASATAAAGSLVTTAGRLVPVSVAERPVQGGTARTTAWEFSHPGGGPGRWSAAGGPGGVGDDVPFSGLDALQSEGGRAVRSTEVVRTVLAGAARAVLVSFSVQKGQEFSLSGVAPVGGAALLVWAPDRAGGTASSYDEPVEALDAAFGPFRFLAPVTGRYVVGHLLDQGQEPGSYEVTVSHPEPVGRVSSAAVSATGTTGLPFRVSWAGADRYDVQWMVRGRTASGWRSTAWRTWLTDTTSTSAVFGAGDLPTRVAGGATYHLRVVPRDDLGGVGDPSASVAVSTPLDDAAPGLRYSVGWQAQRLPDRFLQTAHSASRAGSSVTLDAEATGFSLVAERSPRSGQVDVLVDGVRRARVDLRGSAQHRAVVWRSGPLPGGIGRHTLTLRVVGTPGRPLVTIDGVAVHR